MTPPHWHDEGHDRAPEIEVIQVMKVTWLRGQGCCERSLLRAVTGYFTMDGKQIAEDDPTPSSVHCAFHEFSHPFDGVANGGLCVEAEGREGVE